ncbi:helix-turn-helix transcriptional regulator, partial [Catenibacterium faecis]
VWKTKSFTDHDIILHFLILDLLHTPLSMSELMDKIDEKTNHIYLYDESTLRKKLKEYVREGVIITNKKGKKNFYQLSEDYIIPHDILDFFSEVSPCGVIGSYILDKQEKEESVFGFKHHYLTQVLESEVLYDLLNAIHEHKYVSLKTSRNRIKVLPLSIFVSVQDGRQYLIAYICQSKKMYSFRLDHIISIKCLEEEKNFDLYRKQLEEMKKHLWGVSFSNGSLETVEFTLHHEPWEEHIYRRLLREKRCGHVERLNENTSRFYAEVYDVKEMVPWIRTFICRIQSISISNKEIENQFKKDLEEMYRYYEGDEDDIS